MDREQYPPSEDGCGNEILRFEKLCPINGVKRGVPVFARDGVRLSLGALRGRSSRDGASRGGEVLVGGVEGLLRFGCAIKCVLRS